jgi:hypothetical protein
MEDKIGVPTGHIGTGSVLLLVDTSPLDAAESRQSTVINTRMCSTIGIDISADKDCTVTVTRLPDGETPGAVSPVGSVIAGTPAFFTYSSLLCPAVLVTVANTGGADMTEFSMHVRGGA